MKSCAISSLLTLPSPGFPEIFLSALAILYVMVYGPLVKQALYDRRMAEMEERIRILEQKQNAGNGNPTTIHIDPAYKPSAEGPKA